MILKYLTKKDDNVDQWNYLDNVRDASVYFDQQESCTVVEITRTSGEQFALALHNTAFLMNESGKTIERLTL